MVRNRLLHVCLFALTVLVIHKVDGFSIRNEQLGKCVQVQEGRHRGSRLVIVECNPGSPHQEWQWLPGSRALRSIHTGECLTALRGQQHETIRLQACWSGAEDGAGHETEGGAGPRGAGGKEEEEGEEEEDQESQSWVCTKKYHLTLLGKGLHLSARQDSSKVFLSKERGQVSKWRTLGNHTVCSERGDSHRHHHHRLGGSSLTDVLSPSLSNPTTHSQSQPMEGRTGPTEMNPGTGSPQPQSTVIPKGTSVMYYMDYGMGWKVTMLVLSSLALVLGTAILILNVYHNKRKKVVCVLKSYTPTGDVSQPGSPVPSERAPLTKHALRPPHSPSLQRGEILIEWKDGTVTPLFDNCVIE